MSGASRNFDTSIIRRVIVNPYLDLATQYGWANYMFQTNQGPSFPAHQFLFGGTSAPSAADDAAGIFASENMYTAWRREDRGMHRAVKHTVEVINPKGGEDQKIYPCFEHQTMADILPTSHAGDTTRRARAPSGRRPTRSRIFASRPGREENASGKDWTNNVDLTPSDVLKDIASLQAAVAKLGDSDRRQLRSCQGQRRRRTIVGSVYRERDRQK